VWDERTVWRNLSSCFVSMWFNYLGFFLFIFLFQRMLESEPERHGGQGCHDSESGLRGTEWLIRKKPRCIGTNERSNPLFIHLFIHLSHIQTTPQTMGNAKRNTDWATTNVRSYFFVRFQVLLCTSRYIAYWLSSSIFTPVSFLAWRTFHNNSLCSFSFFFNFRKANWLFRKRILTL